MGISLNRLRKKKLDLGLRKLSGAGIDVERWLAMCDANAATMLRLVTAWPIRHQSFVHDAKTVCGVLGLPCNCIEEAPKAADGEVVVWYGGWTLGALVATGKVDSCLESEWEAMKAPVGYYHTCIPVPDSNRLTHDEEIALLTQFYAALKELPTPVGATALAVHRGVTGKDLLKRALCRCFEELPLDHHPVLSVSGGCVHVDFFSDDRRHDRVFLGAARKA